jgi:hypothetical protein
MAEAQSLVAERPFKPTSDKTRELSVKEILGQILENSQQNIRPQQPIEEPKKKPAFAWPKAWGNKIEKNSQAKDQVVVLFFDQKGYIRPPILTKIQAGNMVIINNAVYEFDPRAMWIFPIGKNMHKVLAIKEIDRRPISNLDLDEVRQRNDQTDSDDFLIKAALAQQTSIKEKKPIPMWLIIVLIVAIVGGLGWFLLSPSTAAPAAAAAVVGP